MKNPTAATPKAERLRSGLEKIKQGMTTVEEVVRVTQLDVF